MRVIYRLLDKSDHAIHVFGLSSDELFVPTGYVVRFDPKTQKWLYPTGDNKPIPWKDRSILDKSAMIIEPGKSIEFDACHSTRETKVIFARTIYVACDPKMEPREITSDKYNILRLK